MPQALDPVTQHHLDQAAERLAEEFVGIFSQETIARCMTESPDLLGGARINVFVPVLAHRFTRERLNALAQAEGTLAKTQPEMGTRRSRRAGARCGAADPRRDRPARRRSAQRAAPRTRGVDELIVRTTNSLAP